MVWNHVAAILLFSGPLFYLGLWMAIDPAGIVRLPEFLFRFVRNAARREAGVAGQAALEPARCEIPRRVRIGLRLAGVILLLVALAA